MKKMSELIAQKKKVFSSHDFFCFLKNKQFPIEQKLTFLPDLSYFVMSFSDINKYFLPFTSPKDELERAVNTHAMEDANHWPWFLHDLNKLNYNQSSPLNEHLKFLWSDNRKNSRILTYKLINLINSQPAKLRLVAIEVMEATGNAMFDALTKLTEDSNITLQYCGNTHLSHETGHTIGSEDELIDTLDYSDAEEKQAIAIINEGFAAFGQFFDELVQNNHK